MQQCRLHKQTVVIYTVMVLIVCLLVVIKGSKHVAVQIAQTDCCDIYCYGIDCLFVAQNNGFTLSQATKALRESRGIALLYFRPLHQKGVRGRRHAPATPYPGKDPVTIVQEAGWAPRLVWTGAENLAPLGFDQLLNSLYTRSHSNAVIVGVLQLSFQATLQKSPSYYIR